MDLVERIYAAEPGPGIVACFDYDGTLIDGFSAKAFYAHRIRHFEIGPIELVKTLIMSLNGIHTTAEFEALLELSLGAWKGLPEESVETLSRKLFKEGIAQSLFPESWELVEAHRRMGHTLVLASSATRFQVAPMARELGAGDILCTPVEIVDGRLTGHTAGPALWGDRKAAAMLALAEEDGLDIEDCFAYSNGTEDIPFLAAAGRPACVDPEPGLAEEAARRGWPVLRCAPRPSRPGVTEVVRTAGFYGAMAGAFWTGLGAGLLNRSRETLVEITGGVGSDVGLAVAGVNVEVVQGAGHLWDARPCVFVFNHQSKLDPIVMMKLLRGGFTGVAKKEAANVPGFGQFFRLAGVAFIDRGNSAQIREALEPAVAKVRDEGISLVIAPEGTRSPTPRLGRFKKGAFHIALQADVPIVPIVMRNVGQVMWRGSQAIRAGTVEVAVLDPIDTSDWDVDALDEHVQEVRDLFVETLANWPTDETRELETAR
jgi:putative phosphoserine phosphatase/1-acylglycerol-3-phosphate O-acyltransferase